MLKVGLTGGIGSGKTTVANAFAALGVPIIDTDRIAHQLVEPGQEALIRLSEHFGPSILQADGSLDRAKLAQVVFSNPTQRKQLESILHPRILTAMQGQIREQNALYCILVIPLLLESSWQQYVDAILVVDIPTELQLKRVVRRDKRSREQAMAIINAQVSREQRLEAADEVIDNSRDEDALLAQVHRLHHHYLMLAQAKN